MKICKDCGENKSYSQYYRKFDNKDGYNSLCRKCYMGRAKPRKDANSLVELLPGDPRHGVNGYHNFKCRCNICADGMFPFQIKRNHGVSVDWYAAKLVEQGFGCAICAARGVPLFIDHDHRCCPTSGRSCGTCARGLLCHYCNVGLGVFYDKPNRLTSAIDYLAAA